MPEIPDPQKSLLELEIVPVDAAELGVELEAPESIPYKISFASYKENECEVYGMKKQTAAVALKVLRDVGLFFTNQGNFQSNCRVRVEVVPIGRAGDYLRVYKDLADDIEVREIKYERHRGDEDISLRIFYYTLEKERTFYAVAIRQTHYEVS